MKAYKGFTKDMKCRGFQFEEGKTYEEDTASLCKSGFPACENPLDVFSYYGPADSVYHEVELEDVAPRREEDSKVCAKRITVGAKLSIKDMIKASVLFVFEKAKEANKTTGACAHAATTGTRAHAATTGDYAHAATTGTRAHAATTGACAHAATTGACAHAATTGNYAHAVTTGDYAHAATTGKNSISVSLGIDGKAKASAGSWIVCAEYDNDLNLIAVRSEKVDGKIIKPDTWYSLKNGAFEEVKADA